MPYFPGIRYAEAPIGKLRFKKPEPPAPWTGEKLAQKGKGVCLQYGGAVLGRGEIYSAYAMLFQNITV